MGNVFSFEKDKMKLRLILFTLSMSFVIQACGQSVQSTKTLPKEPKEMTDNDWKQVLTPQEYDILRKQGTERAFTGKYWDNKEDGVYMCKGCGTELFDSETKFKSGTGWPSFYDVSGNNVAMETDRSYGMVRSEVHCANCGGHLGHVFDDGPKPTGLRYCINSASLDFKKR